MTRFDFIPSAASITVSQVSACFRADIWFSQFFGFHPQDFVYPKLLVQSVSDSCVVLVFAVGMSRAACCAAAAEMLLLIATLLAAAAAYCSLHCLLLLCIRLAVRVYSVRLAAVSYAYSRATCCPLLLVSVIPNEIKNLSRNANFSPDRCNISICHDT